MQQQPTRSEESGVPVPQAPVGGLPPRRRRGRFRLAALAAAVLLYAGGLVVAYELVQRAWYGEGRVAGQTLEGGPADDGAEVEAPPAYDRDAARSEALRARASVFFLESGGSTLGSAFVAWVMQGDSYLLTAYRTVAPLLAQDRTTVFVRGGSRFWTGEIVRSHRTNGLALVRVEAELGIPLWQQRSHGEPVEAGAPVLVVPAGEGTALAEGRASAQERGRNRVALHAQRLHVGAPVLTASGRIAGVVTTTDGTAAILFVPIEGACQAEVRRCA